MPTLKKYKQVDIFCICAQLALSLRSKTNNESTSIPKLKMKKYIVSIVVMIAAVCAAGVNAQFRYGAAAGVTITDLKFKQDLITIDQSVGGSAGIVGEMMFPGIGFGIDLGLLYTQRGATLHLGERKIWESDGYGDERCYLHYVEIPINLRFKYTNLAGIEDYVAPFIFGGPAISFLAAKSDINALEYAGGELGLTAGFGLEIFKKWQVSGSYTWGMTYALKTKLLDDFSAKNRTWNVKVAYFF